MTELLRWLNLATALAYFVLSVEIVVVWRLFSQLVTLESLVSFMRTNPYGIVGSLVWQFAAFIGLCGMHHMGIYHFLSGAPGWRATGHLLVSGAMALVSVGTAVSTTYLVGTYLLGRINERSRA